MLRKVVLCAVALALAGCKDEKPASTLRDTPADAPATTGATPGGDDPCFESRPADGTDTVVWLTQLQTSQAKLEAIFKCANKEIELPEGESFGHGSLVAGKYLWNIFQAQAGAFLWGGKILRREGEDIWLLNKMVGTGDLRYRAKVIKDEHSHIDNEPTIVLDYRYDTTAQTPANGLFVQPIIDPIANGIRDEIREVKSQSGRRTKVYVGRALLFKEAVNYDGVANASSSPQAALTALPQILVAIETFRNRPWAEPGVKKLSDADFHDTSKYFFAANFVLDFNQQ